MFCLSEEGVVVYVCMCMSEVATKMYYFVGNHNKLERIPACVQRVCLGVEHYGTALRKEMEMTITDRVCASLSCRTTRSGCDNVFF